MENYFRDFGDHMPNQDEGIAISADNKIVIFGEYEADRKLLQQPTVHYNTFLKIWRNLFPKVKLRTFCDIPGKCSTCAIIEAKRKEMPTYAQKLLADAHAYHRATFMSERLE